MSANPPCTLAEKRAASRRPVARGAGAAQSYGAETPRPGVRAFPHPGWANIDVGAPPRQENRAAASARFQKVVTDLPYFDSRARIFKLLLDLCSFFLVDAFLDRLRRRLDEIFRFLEAERGDRADFLDHVDLLLADRGQDHVEL